MPDMMPDWMPALLLGQDNQALPPVPGELPSSTAAPGGANTTAPGPGAPAGGGSPFGGDFFLIICLMIGVMLIFSIMGQRRDRKKREALIGAIKKHDRVQTIGGVIGSVVEIKPDTVVLKVDESSNTRITFARSAIQQVLTVSAEPAAAKAE